MAVGTDSKLFRAALVSPEAQLLEAEVRSVKVPAHDGMIGILTHRAPLLTKLGTGVLELDLADGRHQRFLISGGYAQMKDNVLTILTDQATASEQITPQTRDALAAQLAAITGADLASMTRRQVAQARLAAMDRLLATGA